MLDDEGMILLEQGYMTGQVILEDSLKVAVVRAGGYQVQTGKQPPGIGIHHKHRLTSGIKDDGIRLNFRLM